MTETAVKTTRISSAFETDNAGVLTMGDEFEFPLNDVEGARQGAFVFHGHVIHTGGGEWVNVYGGDPVKKDQAHRRQWHALSVDRVRTEARPIRSIWRSKRA